jgi:hypothetical protein
VPSAGDGLLTDLSARLAAQPFNGIATAIFLLAVLHTFFAARFTELARRLQARRDREATAMGLASSPSVAAELLHFVGEVEVVFGLWVVPLLVFLAAFDGWPAATHYVNDTVNYTEALFVVIIMALASTRPLVELAEGALHRLASVAGATTGAWWLTILIVAPMLGSFITEPGAMTIAALLLSRHVYSRGPSPMLKYATLGLLFVNVSIGGTLTHFAAPPVLMVARVWSWDTAFMLSHFGWRAALAIIISTVSIYVWFRSEFRDLATRSTLADLSIAEAGDIEKPSAVPIPLWVTLVYAAFMAWTVMNAHYPALLIGGFLFFLGFDRATAAYSTLTDFKTPLLVGFFLAGLVIHGGWQAWWIAPVLSRLDQLPLFLGATALTAFNDNALITYLATLVPDLTDSLKLAVVQGAVTGGGLTVIANAPNPAGQALLSKYFDQAVHPMRLFLGALAPTLIAAAVFWFL